MEQKDKTQSRTKKIIGLVAGFGAMILIQQFFFKSPSFDQAMMEAASELNKSCPIMVDKETRLDNAVALPENTFQYNYTLVNAEKASVDIEYLTNYLEPALINNVKTSPDLKVFRDQKTTMAYYYKDMNGEFITKIEVTANEYEN
tara:strand:+ start:139 stop:573 length:435 start_codon:yes stop_codon:yes gene_type:complete